MRSERLDEIAEKGRQDQYAERLNSRDMLSQIESNRQDWKKWEVSFINSMTGCCSRP